MAKEELREAVTFENNGEKIFGIIHRPLKPLKSCPAVLICPGFQGSKSGKFRLFVNLAKQLAKHGVVVLRFDYRGSGDSEGEFSDLTLEGKISDALTCLNFLSQDAQVDPERIGLLGRSLGGAVSILTANRFKKIKSLVLWAPVFKSDPWRQLYEALQSNKLEGQDLAMLKRLPAHIPNLEFLTQFFQINLENELKQLEAVPLLHLHGCKDMTVGMEHALAFKKAREGIGQSRFVELLQSDHEFSDAAEQVIAIDETLKWYLDTL